MKPQIVVFVTLFVCVFTSPLPQTLEEAKADVAEPAQVTVEAAPPTDVAAENEKSTDTPTTTELAAAAAPDPAPEASNDVESDKEDVPVAPVAAADPVVEAVDSSAVALAEKEEAAAVAPTNELKSETAEANAEEVKEDVVNISDTVEPAAVASNELPRAVRTPEEEEEKKESDVAATTAAAVATSDDEEKPAEEPKAKLTEADEAQPATEETTADLSSATTAADPVTTAAAVKAEVTTTVAATTTSAAPAQSKDSSEESKESQESDEDKS